MKYWDKIQKEIGIQANELDVCNERSPERLFKVDKKFNKGRAPIHAEMNLYTDGSKLDDRVGAGFAAIRRQKVVCKRSFCLPQKSTVFQAEILAIREAARFLNEELEYKNVRLFVDSQAALMALGSPVVSSPLVMETIRELNKAAANKHITLKWVEAHVGTEGNEIADELAKFGTKGGTMCNIGLPKAELKGEIESLFYNRWKDDFESYEGARMGKIFYKGPDKNKAKYVMKLPRLKLARFVRII